MKAPITANADSTASGASRIPPLSDVGAPGRESKHEQLTESGRFLKRTHVSSGGTRHYKVYVPGSYCGEPLPVVVMLHGCTQSPDDFAAGTCMNQLAERQHFLVVYPAQSTAANGLRCWNWFNSKDQVRDGGEPSLIAGITTEVLTEFAVDQKRIYVAGLSAGAAMAIIMGETYPDLYSAVGVHSGLPYRAASNVSAAFAAMRGNGPPKADAGSLAMESATRYGATNPIPTIVFHGDQDSTVSMENGLAIVAQAIERTLTAFGPLQKTVRERVSINYRESTIMTCVDAQGRPLVEHWIIHGAGHAWSGGSRDGSHTDEVGAHASAEMVRFFLAQTHTVAPAGSVSNP